MKRLSLSLFILLSTTLFSLTNSIEMNLSGTKLSQIETIELWHNLFTSPRTQSCRSAEIRKSLKSQLKSEGVFSKKNSENFSFENKFTWIKKWGYGPLAYLIDYLDPSFQKDIVTAFEKLLSDVSKESKEDTENFQDPFKHKKPVNKMIFENSVNAVQINTIMPKYKWRVEPGQVDYADRFIMQYDIDNDGRLNPRELILGAIMHNRNSMGSGNCENCFQEIAKKLDAIFIFIDCNNDGNISAQDLWDNLPKLIRSTPKWNIFSISNKDSIRTSSVNDFVLKNGNEGTLDKESFRIGVLLAYWDRQTSEQGVINDNSRNLKTLRWKYDGMIDTNAYNFLKEKELADRIAKAIK